MDDVWFKGETDISSENGTTIAEDLDANLERQWHYLVLAVVPIACILGNCMVVAAVWTTRSLQTPTNYLLVSLAIADLVVGSFVMPFSIYLSVNSLHWHLPLPVCHFYCVLDVAASTCSIVHLVLISVDRLVAATKPAEYKTAKHRKRIYMAIGLAWIFSIGLSMPLGTGFNTKTRQFLLEEHHCGIYSPMYMFCSSIFAFYLPCLIMIITYSFIFYTLRKRLQAIQLQEMAGGQFVGFGADVGNITNSAMQTVIGISAKNRNAISWEKPLLKKIEETAAEHASSLNESEREQLQTILEAVQPSSSGSQEMTQFEEESERPPSVLLDAVTMKLTITEGDAFAQVLQVPRPTYVRSIGRRFSDAVQTISQHNHQKFDTQRGVVNALRRFSCQTETHVQRSPSEDLALRLTLPHEKKKMRRLSEIISEWERPSRVSLSHMYSLARRESVFVARKKLAGLKDWALDLLAKLRSRQGIAIRRETRATKLVATVMVVFLVCWLPFFTLNMIKVYKLMFNNWPRDLEVWFHWFTALGYLNSSLNFFIYSAINQKFRSSFRRLIRYGCSKQRTTWMLPPKEAVQEPFKCCGCGPFTGRGQQIKIKQSTNSRLVGRKVSVNKPKIVINEVTNSLNHLSISGGGITTIRHSSDDVPLRRSSSEIIGAVSLSSDDFCSRRNSNMSNSSGSLQFHGTQKTTTVCIHDQGESRSRRLRRMQND
ncbi:Dopamine D2-like receptor [Toxocara canis]|uniref:Dopamine D2-like receptor n=1 Tax=Toxocara canis TaxID=6265 RepID=A0A0B2UX04_TOXCA|nr:Dopamine D2-like receptor [Toxocara canis]